MDERVEDEQILPPSEQRELDALTVPARTLPNVEVTQGWRPSPALSRRPREGTKRVSTPVPWPISTVTCLQPV